MFEQTLTEANWILDVCEAYDLVRESSTLSAEDRRAIREDFLLKVAENIAKHKAGKSNWQTYHNAAFMMIGGVLGRADLVRQAIDDRQDGFDYQMEASVLPGGMWYENSWGYDPTGSRRTVAGAETQSKLLCLRQEAQKPAQILAEAKD